MSAAERVVAGTIVGERFEVERIAGTGGMGDVYRARDLQTGAPIAVKFVRHSADAYAARFEREARALAQFSHPGIVRYVAHGKEPAIFLAMEWLEGEDLSRRLSRGPLTITETLRLAKRVADALAAAHARGIVHRDIKPSNIFLCDGAIDDAKILDFGVAQVAKSTLAITGTGQLIGTLGYMAPEQALSGRDVTPAADVFSLGCVLFECITGRGPFAGEWAEVLSKILLSEAPRLRELRKDAPLVLDELLGRMLRKDPAARASLASVATDVATFLTAGDVEPSEWESTGEVPAVTGDERRLVAVIVTSEGQAVSSAAPPRPPPSVNVILESDRLTPSADTMPSSAVHLGHVVAKFDGQMELLPDNTPLITLASGGAATDLATRAARCALAIRELLPKARIAVASGRGDPSQGAVMAEVVGRAKKLLSIDSGKATTSVDGQKNKPPPRGSLPPSSGGEARPVRIDAITAGLLDSTFEVSGDASALQLVGQRERNSVRKLLGKPTPCVGRERELAMLQGVVAECLDEPLATALLITANAGVGKSRLRYEILRGLRDRDDAPEVWLARGDPITSGSPFGMLAQLLRSMSGLVEGEIVEVRRQKLLARVGRNLPLEDATRVAQFLGELVRAEFSGDERPALRAARQDPALMNDQLRRAWDDLIAAETAAGPVIIVLEDLQWGDLPTVRFVDAVLRTQRHRPLLVLAVARPEVHETFPDLFRDRRLNELRLSDLTPSASRKLVLDVLGADVDPTLIDALVDKAHGNAFYLEELIRSVAEGTSAMPGTVLAMVQARLERLDPGARRLLRAASVFGSRFWTTGVAALIGADPTTDDSVHETLQDLVQREVVMHNPSSRFQGDVEYTFRHILVRDAAYEMLTERDRKASHLLAAEWLEARGEREALVLAEHLERSGERQRAVVWYLWAAEQALEGNDLTSVLDRAERGIECGAQGVMLGELYLLKAEASGWSGRGGHLELAEQALGLLPPGSASWARAASELAVACRAIGDRERLCATAETLLAASKNVSDMSMGHAWGIARTVVELLGAGEAALAEKLIPAINAATKHADERDVPTLFAMVEWLRAAVSLHAGEPQPLLALAEDVVATFEANGHVRYSALVALHAAIASASMGDWTKGVSWAERAADLARRLGLRSFELRARAWMALHFARNGLSEIALATATSAVRDATGDRVVVGEAHVHLAHIHLASRNVDSALEEANLVWKDRSFSADSRGRAGGILARLLLLQDRVDEALEIANEALGVLERVQLLKSDSEVRQVRDEAAAAVAKA
jgi:eukaryotic-like serine/threonine-protein kinase